VPHGDFELEVFLVYTVRVFVNQEMAITLGDSLGSNESIPGALRCRQERMYVDRRWIRLKLTGIYINSSFLVRYITWLDGVLGVEKLAGVQGIMYGENMTASEGRGRIEYSL
jgi:hypothetical protein